MKTFSIRSFVATAVLALTSFAAVAHAQSSKVTATVPFAFEYSGHAYAAGQYSFSANSGNIVKLSSGDQIQMAMAQRGAAAPGATTKIMFDRTNGQYYLRQIVLGQKAQSLRFPESRNEKQARTVKVAGNMMPSVVEVAVVAAQ